MNVSYPLLNKNFKVNSKYGARWGRQHKGVDLEAEVGTRVISILPGKVVKAGNFNDGYGGQVLIKHKTNEGIIYSRYAHLKKWYVRDGEEISQNQKIGESGGEKGDPNAGRSTGPHLHFEILDGGQTPMDPEPIIKNGVLGAAALSASTGKNNKTDKLDLEDPLSTSTSTDGVIDKFMAKASKAFFPVGALASLKGISEENTEKSEKLLEEVDRIKQLLK